MIKIFSPTDKIFTSNGDKVIQPLRAKVYKEDNGEYYLDLDADLSYIDYIVQDNIIVAPTPTGEQPFRINNVTRTRKKLSVKANHVYFDSQNYLISDSYVVDKNCNNALDHLNSSTEPSSPFNTISDIPDIDSYRCVRTSLFEAINTVLDRWGGHLVRDGFTIGIRSSIGSDNGVTIRYGKNLQDITVDEDWNEVVTKILPVGNDGLTLPELYLESDIQYSKPYVKSISFEQDLEQDENETDDDFNDRLIRNLRAQAIAYLNVHKYPKINYTIKANIDRVTDIGDTIEVIDERLGIDLLTHIISFEYDCISGKFSEISFGNSTNKLSGLSDMISSTAEKATQAVESQINNTVNTLNNNIEEAYYQIWAQMGSSYVLYNGDMILVVDKLPKEEARNCILINSGGIAFSQSGINGTFTSAWTIDGTLNMEAINVINLVADMIKGGTLKLGSNLDEFGIIELYDESNKLIGKMDKLGLTMYGIDGSSVQLNPNDGLVGYDLAGNKIYWISDNEFHMKRSVIEEEITLCNKMRFIPITITDVNDNIISDGIGLVPTLN